MNKINAFSIFGMMVMLACSSGTDPVDDVVIKIKNQNLVLENNTESRVYYIALESEFATLVDWSPGFSGPFMEGGKTVSIPFSDIENGKEDPVGSGDRILIWWWTDENKDNPLVQYESIRLM